MKLFFEVVSGAAGLVVLLGILLFFLVVLDTAVVSTLFDLNA